MSQRSLRIHAGFGVSGTPQALVLTPPKRRRAPRKCDPEDTEQARVIAWADDPATQRRLPEVAELYAIPNGGWRHKKTAGLMKVCGCRPGMPDLALPIPRGPYPALYIEMKALDGTLSPAQRERIPRLERYGNKVVVAHGAAKAIAAIEAYLALPRWNVGRLGAGEATEVTRLRIAMMEVI